MPPTKDQVLTVLERFASGDLDDQPQLDVLGLRAVDVANYIPGPIHWTQVSPVLDQLVGEGHVARIYPRNPRATTPRYRLVGG